MIKDMIKDNLNIQDSQEINSFLFYLKSNENLESISWISDYIDLDSNILSINQVLNGEDVGNITNILIRLNDKLYHITFIRNEYKIP